MAMAPSDRFEKLSTAKQALLKKRIQNALSGATGLGSIKRRKWSGSVPLSFAQQRQWFLNQLEPHSAAYNRPLALRLRGELDHEVLQQALNEIVRRHDVLRERFIYSGEKLFGEIAQFKPLSLSVVDLSQYTPVGPVEAAQRLGREEAQRPFNLATDRIMRASLLRLGMDDHVLLLVFHHIAFDAWSAGVLVKELVRLYTAFARGEASPLADLPIQYADYAEWQQERFQELALDEQTSFWKNLLADPPPALELPVAGSRPETRSDRGGICRFKIPVEMVRSLEALAREEGATQYMVLLAAFQSLLYRYSGQNDLVLGTPVGGRMQVETEGLIGLFINTLALRFDLSGEPAFRELLNRVKTSTLEAFSHQEMPFDKLVQVLNPIRVSGQTPIFQIMFNLENFPAWPDIGAGLHIEPFEFETQISQFDLTLEFDAHPDRLSGAFVYSMDLFDVQTIEGMCGHYLTLLEGCIAAPDRSISRLPLLTRTGRSHMVSTFNDTLVEHSSQECLHQLFEAQVEKNPDTTALTFQGYSWTYDELNGRSNQLARYLREANVGPDVLVGICMDQSPHMFEGILGVIKAGGAYVPLEPDLPPSRLDFLIQDTRLRIILTQEKWLNRIPQFDGQVICLDRDASLLDVQSRNNLVNRTHPDNLLCAIYTSGSSGTPKAVMVPHRGIVNYLRFFIREYHLDREVCALLVTNFGFDASIRSIFGPWLVGGVLVVPSKSEASDPYQLISAILDQNANSLLAIVPTMLRVLVDAMLEKGLSSDHMRLILSGGESLFWSDVEKVRQVFGTDVLVVNHYGPTECSMVVSYYPVRERPSQDGRVPIGGPVWNARLYILDEYFEPTPIGVPGEIYIGGTPVTRGYLGRPDLCALVFLPDPFSPEQGSRMYRTGDVGTYLPDGNIAFIGRNDAQVKIRGIRVELGEIEAMLSSHKEIKQAIVVAGKERDGGKFIQSTQTTTRLLAYVMLVSGKTATASELKAFLSRRLPEYMVPSDWIFLSEFPLTPNGKVDRNAMPAPSTERTNFSDYVSPRDHVEEKLCQIWEEVLQVKPIGIFDNFFNLGGHSLLAIRLLTEMEKIFGESLPLVALLQSQTLVEQASLLRQEMTIGSSIGGIPRREGDKPAALSFSQEGLWFLQQMEAASSIYNMACTLRIHGRMSVDALVNSLRRIVHRHEILRTRFVVIEDSPKQVVDADYKFDYSIIDLESIPEDRREVEMQRLARQEGNRPFDLETGPLWRAVIFKMGGLEYVLAIFLHHTIFDEWSQEVMFKELSLFYRQEIKGDKASLPPLPIQYADFAAWQRIWLQGEELERQLAYWLGKLADAPHGLNLPTDYPHPAVQNQRGSIRRRMIPLKLLKALQDLSRQERVTLFTTLLAVFQVLLHRYSGQDDLLVGTPIANRRWTEVENLIGYFLNTLVVRAVLHGNPGFNQFLKQLSVTMLEAFDHQDLPFEHLVAELQPQRSLDRHPLFQEMFVLHASPLPTPELVDLEVTPFKLDYGKAMFDLSLTLTPTQQGLDAWLEYSTDLYDAETIDRMLEHYERLLQGVVADPGCPVALLPILPEREYIHILEETNQTRAAFPDALCVHQLFQAQAEAHPGATALIHGEGQITYHELNQRANRLAGHLQELGVGPEVCVGACMVRSVELLVGILGILKAGGVYVPIDPFLPLERQAFILENAQIEILLTRERDGDQLGSLNVRILNLDADWDAALGDVSETSDGTLSSCNLAYVIYTSGSTGEPKGVMVSHRSLVNHLTWMRKFFDLKEGDRGVQTTSLSFDVSLCELLGPLIFGGGLVIAEPDIPRDIDKLIDLMIRRRVSIIHVVPYLLQGLVQHPRLPACTSLRHVVCGGEELPPDLPVRFYENCRARLYNLYGPTEFTIDALFWPIPQLNEYTVIPVGKPITNVQAYILDEYMQPVPLGVPGELYLAGEGMARGYLKNPELTAERFVPNPFGTGPGERLYRTGDLVRYLADDGIVFMGRLDQQVKLRGSRIELGEIEVVLRSHPSVEQAIATLIQESPGDKYLAAYVVPKDEQSGDALELRSYMRTRLPEYMLPATFVFLDKFPLTDSGKINRNALPEPDRSSALYQRNYAPPTTPVARVVADVWASVLEVDRVGMTDNFFELGGHSLLAIRLTSRMQDAFQLDLPVRIVFEAQTMADYCEMMLDWSSDRERIEQIAQLLIELAEISEDEADRLLSKKSSFEE